MNSTQTNARQARAYSAPRLQVFGAMRTLTAAGTGNNGEASYRSGNNPNAARRVSKNIKP